MRDQRGVANSTLDTYQSTLVDLLKVLGDNPTVFTGSSNLAEGGEQANGDSLIMIEDQALASIYAIEALKIFDHYAYRDRMKSATAADAVSPFKILSSAKPAACIQSVQPASSLTFSSMVLGVYPWS